MLHRLMSGGGIIDVGTGDTEAGAVFAAVYDRRHAPLATGLHQRLRGFNEAVAQEDQSVGFMR